MKTKILLSLLFASIAQAVTITGVGYGESEEKSLQDSLSDLSNRISVEVKSDIKSYVSTTGKKFKKHEEDTVSLSSSLPIKGATFSNVEEPTFSQTTATLDSATALKLYTYELKRLKKELAFSQNELQHTKDKNLKYELLNSMLKDIKSFNKHRIVATLLGAKNPLTLAITRSSVELELQKLQNKIPSLKIASSILSKGIREKNIYISAIKPSGSSEITQFAKMMKESMAQNLKTVKYPADAAFILKGNYEILKNSIFVTLTLLDKKNSILLTRTATLAKSAYKNLHYKPKTETFDASLRNGFVKSGKLYVDVGFKGYSRVDGIDLEHGDSVDIVVKTNKPMCYFLVGYVLKDKDKFAYLLPIGSDNQPYINALTGSDINRNITIFDKVPVEPPFGSESLQIFSSTFKKDGSCPLVPPRCEENDEGYCVIKGKVSDVVVHTRGLNLKKRKYKVEKAESSIRWNSFEK